MGRPPIGKIAMTGAERVRRHRLKQRAEQPVTKPVTKLGPDDAASEIEMHLALAHGTIIKHLDHIERAHKSIADRDKYIAKFETRLKEAAGKFTQAQNSIEGLERLLTQAHQRIAELEAQRGASRRRR